MTDAPSPNALVAPQAQTKVPAYAILEPMAKLPARPVLVQIVLAAEQAM